MLTTQESNRQKIRTLRDRGDADSVKELITILLEEKDPSVRSEIVKTLRSLRRHDPVVPLIGALRIEDRHARMAAVEALGDYGDHRAVEHVTHALRDRDASVRSKAAEALGKLGDRGAVKQLTQALGDRSASVRVMAAEALGRIGDARAVESLVAAMVEGNTILRAPVADALGKIGDAGAIGPLADRLEDGAWDIQWSAAKALERIGGPQAAGALISWGKRVFSSTAKNLSADEKSQLVCEVMSGCLRKLEKDQLQFLRDKIGSMTWIKSWETVDPAGDDGRWTEDKYENPIWTALQEELTRRKLPLMDALESQGLELDETPDDLLNESESDEDARPIEPVAPESQSAEKTQPPLDLPKPEGLVAEFLRFLVAHRLDSIALVGGAARDVILGRTPRDLDVTVQVKVPEALLRENNDPFAWNQRLADLTRESVEALARALEIGVEVLIAGQAVFPHGDTTVPIHYVGPYWIEEKRTTYRDFQLERRLHHVVSRLGLVADLAGDQIVGLVSTTPPDRIWLDAQARWHGDGDSAKKLLDAKMIHVDQPVAKPGIEDIIRVLYSKRTLNFTLSEPTVDLLLSAADGIRNDPDSSRQSFSKKSFDRLLATSDFETVVGDFECLDLLPTLMDTLEGAKLQRLDEILARRDKDRTENLREARRTLDEAKTFAEETKQRLASKRLEFNKQLDQADVFKATRYDLEERLRAQISLLSEADQSARKAADVLEEATRRIQSMTSGDQIDVESIQKHREALAHKRIQDAEVAGYKKEVDALRLAVDKKQAAMIEVQSKMERLGAELEAASLDHQTARQKVTKAESALHQLEAESTLTPQLRREKLRR